MQEPVFFHAKWGDVPLRRITDFQGGHIFGALPPRNAGE